MWSNEPVFPISNYVAFGIVIIIAVGPRPRFNGVTHGWRAGVLVNNAMFIVQSQGFRRF